MNKLSLFLLTLLTSAIIVAITLTSPENFWAISVPILSLVLGWLLKTISDSITINQQHQWDLEKIAHERTLNYYETKLSEMSLFVIDELVNLASYKWVPDSEKGKTQNKRIEFTKDWLVWSSSARTFAQVVGDEEIVTAYTETVSQSSRWLDFVDELNSGKLEIKPDEDLQIKAQNEMGLYIEKLKNFQWAIEHVRLKVLRGEIMIKQDGKKR